MEVFAARERAARDPLLSRIAKVQGHLRDIANLLPELEAELKVRQTAFEELRAEAEQTERYAALHKDHAEAVQKLVDENRKTALTEATALVVQELAKTSKTGGRQQLRFFILAGLLAIPLSLIANVLWEWLK
ncbi:protein kinase family protein [Plantactinospora soyae]|uniref:Precorrin-6B methylase 1 n=1 Tax=Plantactinospora soyae TaxID=1544732 RepID=A0A927M2R8_9ACTN|nr:hypothetical protein [Plantactinospora soyae]MBE1485601.1 precorrin-6B methylase 1 [Plantactinospora soyae]